MNSRLIQHSIGILLLNLFTAYALSAQWSNKTLTFGATTRNYRVYQSPNYNASNPAALIIALHGLGDNMTNFSAGLNFSSIADTANIICIYPQALSDPFVGAAWNSSAGTLGYYPNSSIDDVGFIQALMDSAISTYAIDLSRIYVCGFSMGGFMTQKLALQANSRIAAFVSLSGTIGSGISSLNPGRQVPLAHFHGTADSVVTYSNGQYGWDVDSLVNFWVNNNACTPSPNIYNYPDIANDGLTVERHEYGNGNPASDFWLYKINGGAHTVLGLPQNDINQTLEVWLFLNRYRLSPTSSLNPVTSKDLLSIYPNPAQSKVHFQVSEWQNGNSASVFMYNLQGALLLNTPITSGTMEIDVEHLPAGMYMLKVIQGEDSQVIRLVKE
jgi:polyhydroxybutyrate depolymerase